MALEIVAIRRGDPDFYCLVGPFLGSRAVAKDLGGPVWDDEGKEWFVAIIDGATAGVCAYLKDGARIRFSSDYVLPNYRGQGVYRQLFAARLKAVGSATLVSTVTNASLDLFVKNGFTVTGKRGQYFLVVRS